jgi:predicted DNA-binding ribbon-helix-helix protein
MSRNTARKAESPRAPAERADASLIAGNVRIHNRRTSVRLEPEMWSALYEIAKMENISIHDICSVVDDGKQDGESFSSSLRVFLLKYYRDAARGVRKPVRLKKRPQVRAHQAAVVEERAE